MMRCDGLVVFKNYVESASNGAIAVELFIGTQLCSKGAECLQGVADNSIDVYISTSGSAAGIFPYVQILDVPYLMSDDRIAEHVLSGDFTRKLRAMALKIRRQNQIDDSRKYRWLEKLCEHEAQVQNSRRYVRPKNQNSRC